jgi:hypothetical protein
MAPLVKYAGERDTGSPKPPQLEYGRLGVTPAVETAYVTSAGRRPERRHIRASGSQDG